jgi:hypothetical protein
MGVVQYEQIGSVADGSEHGMRTGTQGNTSQHALSGTHIHFVRIHTFVSRFDPEKNGAPRGSE